MEMAVSASLAREIGRRARDELAPAHEFPAPALTASTPE